MYTFLNQDIWDCLVNNYKTNQARINQDLREIDFKPVVKLFTPDANATWLLTELDPVSGIAFGYCDLGQGTPEIGYVSLLEIADLRGPMNLPVERDLHFNSTHPLSWYIENNSKQWC